MPSMEGMGDVGMPDTKALLSDPQLIEAFKNPVVREAFKDISQNPANLKKYDDHKVLKPILDRIGQKYAGAGSGSGDSAGAGVAGATAGFG